MTMKRFWILSIIILFPVTVIFAQQNSGLAEEFTKLEDYLRNPKLTEEQKKRILKPIWLVQFVVHFPND